MSPIQQAFDNLPPKGRQILEEVLSYPFNRRLLTGALDNKSAFSVYT